MNVILYHIPLPDMCYSSNNVYTLITQFSKLCQVYNISVHFAIRLLISEFKSYDSTPFKMYNSTDDTLKLTGCIGQYEIQRVIEDASLNKQFKLCNF